MNKIVREHYPVANLPEDLREGFDSGAIVKVVIEVEAPAISREALLRSVIDATPIAAEDLMEMRRELLSDGRPSVTMEEAVARIRELRDEWDY